LQNVVLHECLGIEVPPEEYMDLGRKILFIVYAMVSYVYRWVVTFSILYLFSTFLRPHKLEVVGNLLTLAAICSMTVWPAYQMVKNTRKRGRLPDMNRTRVTVTCTVLAIVVLILALVPMPISRIRGLALVQPHPDGAAQISLKRSAILERLKVSPGESVTKGQPLAYFRDPDLEAKLGSFRAERDSAREYLRRLEQQKANVTDNKDKNRLDEEMVQTIGRRNIAQVNINVLETIQQEELVLHAPLDGVIGQGPKIEDIGKLFDGGREQAVPPVFTMHTPDQLRVCLPLVTSEYNQLRENLVELKKNKSGKEPDELAVVMRVHGLDSGTWKGHIARLDQSEAKFVPLALSTRGGGPVPVQPPTSKAQGLVPQTQHYLVYIDIVQPGPAITVGSMAQVKIRCRPETCLSWAWRTVNNVFNLRLM
jgi:putative peptide zinc metalloprotease protein